MSDEEPIPDLGWSEHFTKFHNISRAFTVSSQKMSNLSRPQSRDKDGLPIDDFLLKLEQRKRKPTLRSKTEKSRPAIALWKVFGPNLLVRHHLAEAFGKVAGAAPQNRQAERDKANKFIVGSMELREMIINFLEAQMDGYSEFPTFHSGQSGEEQGNRFYEAKALEFVLGEAVEYLEVCENWARNRYDAISPESGGRPRSEWRHEFVSYMAHTWMILTGQDAPAGPNSLFVEFVETAWASGDESLEEISWEATIRSVVSKRSAKTPTISAKV